MTKWKMWSNGFLPGAFVEYNFTLNKPGNYINDFDRVTKANFINGENAILLDNKLLFAFFLRNENRVILLELYIKNGNFFLFETGKFVEINYVFDNLKNNQFILKPFGEGGGKGIFFMDSRQEQWEIDGISYSNVELTQLFKNLKDYLIFKRIKQVLQKKLIPIRLIP